MNLCVEPAEDQRLLKCVMNLCVEPAEDQRLLKCVKYSEIAEMREVFRDCWNAWSIQRLLKCVKCFESSQGSCPETFPSEKAGTEMKEYREIQSS